MSSKNPGNHQASSGSVPTSDGSAPDASQYLQSLLSKPASSRPAAPTPVDTPRHGVDGVVIGRLVGVDSSGRFLVQYSGAPREEAVPALAAVALEAGAVGRDVALSFLQGDPGQPLILGLLHGSPTGTVAAEPVEVQRDGERLVLTADREIVLRCGESSITLTKAGKVLIRGKYLLSRSDGVNRIKGGAVQIN